MQCAIVRSRGAYPALLVLGGGYLIATLLPGLRREWAELNRA